MYTYAYTYLFHTYASNNAIIIKMYFLHLYITTQRTFYLFERSLKTILFCITFTILQHKK